MESLSRLLPSNVLRSTASAIAPRAQWRRQCLRTFTTSKQARQQRAAADDPNWESIVDRTPVIVRAGRKHGPGLILLALIPTIAFGLGTWQIQRLGWKTDLISRFEDRLVLPPLPLPPRIDPAAIKDFDYRRVTATGRLRHDQEMLIGPRILDGEDGYLVITPLEREGKGSTILVNRGWIRKDKRSQRVRAARSGAALPTGEVTIEGLLREPWKKNMFTPDNKPEKGEFYFPDVEQMAAFVGSQPVWIEATMSESPSTSPFST